MNVIFYKYILIYSEIYIYVCIFNLDLKSVSVDFHDSSSYDCNTLVSEKMELEENDEHKHPYRSTTTAVPCWYIVAPLLLIIFIILGICLFHSITAGITYYKIKKNRRLRNKF